jgi:cytochrome c-type biogenesis protein CcmH
VWRAERLVRFRLPLVLGLLLLLGLTPLQARADPADDAVRRVAVQLQCPVCEGETVWDSGSKLAADMRSVIRAKQAAGESDQQILDEFVGSYGDGILTEPPKRGISLGVWIGPLIGVAIGASILALVVKQWRASPARSAAPVTTPDPAVADELRRFREGLEA